MLIQNIPDKMNIHPIQQLHLQKIQHFHHPLALSVLIFLNKIKINFVILNQDNYFCLRL